MIRKIGKQLSPPVAMPGRPFPGPVVSLGVTAGIRR